MQLRIVPLSGMGGPYSLKDEEGPPGYIAQWIKDKKLAYMFAAAPDLLEVCKDVLELRHYTGYELTCVVHNTGLLNRLRAAVAKAEGRNEK